jgi:DNA-binding transcriptional ArsR family regulator
VRWTGEESRQIGPIHARVNSSKVLSGLDGMSPAGRYSLEPKLLAQTPMYLDMYVPVLLHGSMDAVLQALSDSNRRTVLAALGEGPATVGELAALLPIARPGVSRHLRVLREVGLVDVHQKAQFRIYSLNAEPLEQLEEWLGHCRTLWEQRMNALHTEVARGKKERRSAQ